MENLAANSALDQNLPKELRGSVEFLGPNKKGEVVGASDPQSEENNMSGTQTSPAMTNEQIRAIANEEAGKLLTQANSQVAIASSIERHLATANVAVAEATQAKAEVEILKTQLTDAQAAAKKASEEVTTVKEANEKAKKDHGDKDEAQKKATAAIETELATAKKKLAEYDAKDKKSSREKAITAAGIKSAKFAGRATASNEDGTLKMTDDEFTAAVEEFKETLPTPAGEQAVAAPIPAPVDKDGPGSKQGAPKGTPVAAPTDKKGPAAGQSGSGFTKAKADEAAAGTGTGTTTETTTQATASVPAEPNLNDASVFAQATAMALAGATQVTQSGKSTYAKHFGVSN